MYDDERLNFVEVGKHYKSELLLDYADTHNAVIITDSINNTGIPTFQPNRECIIKEIFDKKYMVYNNNGNSINKVIFAEYL